MDRYLSRLVVERMSPQVLVTANKVYPAWLDQFSVAREIYDPEIVQYTMAVAYARAILEYLVEQGVLETMVDNGGQVRYRALRSAQEVGR